MAPIRKHHRRGWFEQPVHFRCSLKATSPIHHHFLLPLPFFNSLLPWRDRNTFRARKQITIYGRQHVMLRLVAPTAVQRRVVAWCRRQRMRRCGTTWLESRLCRHQLQDYIDRTDCPVEAAATLRRRFGAPTTALPECTVPISDLWPQSARRPIPSWIPCRLQHHPERCICATGKATNLLPKLHHCPGCVFRAGFSAVHRFTRVQRRTSAYSVCERTGLECADGCSRPPRR